MKKEKTLSTTNFSTLQALCKDAQAHSQFIGVVGYPVAGKTTSLQHYYEKTSHAFYIRAKPSMSAKQFFYSLLFELGIEGKSQGNSLHDLINSAAHQLNYTKSKKLLIIDEAGKFKPKFLEYLHELRDNTENNTGIVMAGPEYFKKNIFKWGDRGIVGIPELLRRVNHWEELDYPTDDEIHAFCEAYGVKDAQFMEKLKDMKLSFADLVNEIKIFLALKKSDDKRK